MDIPERPITLQSVTIKSETPCGNLFVTVTFLDDGTPQEIFSRLGKSGTCFSAGMDALSRAMSFGLRAGLPLDIFVKSLNGIECEKAFMQGKSRCGSCWHALGKTILEAVEDWQSRHKTVQTSSNHEEQVITVDQDNTQNTQSEEHDA